MHRLSWTVAFLFALSACDETQVDGDAGMDAEVSPVDAGRNRRRDGGRDGAVRLDGGPDAAPSMDDAGSDSGSVSDAGSGPRCGNAVIEAGEECDDGNVTIGDGCFSDCSREPYCGDGNMDRGEICDDGNNRSDDGCRSDCLSNETCGNSIIDYARGEICDSTRGCLLQCKAIEACGDGVLAASEGCDDSNAFSWDGCSSACTPETVLVVDTLNIATSATQGCDLDVDGRVDNRLGPGLGTLGAFIGSQLQNDVRDGSLLVLMAFLGLDDPQGIDDNDLRIAWMRGQDVDADASNNFTGSAELRVVSSSLDVSGTPNSTIQSSIAARMLSGGPESISIPFRLFPIDLMQGRVRGTTEAVAGRLYRTDAGLLCGGVRVSLLATLRPDLAGDIAMANPACDASTVTIADLLIAGGDILVDVGGGSVSPFAIGPAAIDLDLDGDGLESFEVLRTGPDGCQGVVTACFDGDGTRIEGRGCMSDPRIVDGYSAAFPFTAIKAQVVGVGP